jgi:putative nucleotidyltransferase with HDIG domain
VRNVAMGFGMVAAMKKLGGTSMSAFWDHALATGAGAMAMAEQMGPQHDPEEAFIAGLMHDIGHVVLASAAPDAWRSVQDQAAAGGDVVALEKETMGMSHASVGERLMAFWQLPEELQQAVRWHHNVQAICSREQPLATLVALGDVLACIHGGNFERPLAEEHLARVLRLHCLETDQVRAALGRMDEKIDEMRVFLKVADDDGEMKTTERLGDAATAAVILSTDEERVAWTGAVLQHLGCTIYPLKAYFNREPGHEQVQLVVLDPNCLTRQQLDKMLPFLDAMPATCAVLRDGSESPLADELSQRYPSLPYVFSRADVLAAVNELVIT